MKIWNFFFGIWQISGKLCLILLMPKTWTGVLGIWSPKKWPEALFFDAKGLISDMDALLSIFVVCLWWTFLENVLLHSQDVTLQIFIWHSSAIIRGQMNNNMVFAWWAWVTKQSVALVLTKCARTHTQTQTQTHTHIYAYYLDTVFIMLLKKRFYNFANNCSVGWILS